jgi:hypothetical protein
MKDLDKKFIELENIINLDVENNELIDWFINKIGDKEILTDSTGERFLMKRYLNAHNEKYRNMPNNPKKTVYLFKKNGNQHKIATVKKI